MKTIHMQTFVEASKCIKGGREGKGREGKGREGKGREWLNA